MSSTFGIFLESDYLWKPDSGVVLLRLAVDPLDGLDPLHDPGLALPDPLRRAAEAGLGVALPAAVALGVEAEHLAGEVERGVPGKQREAGEEADS